MLWLRTCVLFWVACPIRTQNLFQDLAQLFGNTSSTGNGALDAVLTAVLRGETPTAEVLGNTTAGRIVGGLQSLLGSPKVKVPLGGPTGEDATPARECDFPSKTCCGSIPVIPAVSRCCGNLPVLFKDSDPQCCRTAGDVLLVVPAMFICCDGTNYLESVWECCGSVDGKRLARLKSQGCPKPEKRGA